MPAAKLAKLQQGLSKLQAEGVLEGIKAAKEQHEQADTQRKADTAAAVGALKAANAQLAHRRASSARQTRRRWFQRWQRWPIC